jgi:F-type H+-transporting ATPase subunit a
VQETTPSTPRWRWGVHRWIVLLMIILGAIGAAFFSPIQPHVQLPAENLTGALFGNFHITNTMVAMLLCDVILLAIGFGVYRATRSGKLVLDGMANAVEAMLEVLYNLAESTAGRWARSIFPIMTTIILLVLVANWMELIPFVDSFGLLEHAEAGGHAVRTIVPGLEATVKEDAAPADGGYVVVPFVRVIPTDLNFTLGLALIAVVMTQVIGLRAQGLSYFTKFLNVRTLFKVPVFGVIDFGVGILELVSEFSKILSFAFRLFGNIFAGSVLLFVIGSLVPVFAQSAVLMLEFFVGLIQAIIFGMLTLVFMAQATQSHHGGEEHPAEAAH